MTLFKDRSKLTPGYVPDDFTDRKDEIGRLSNLYLPVLSDAVSQRALVHGGGGSGKTAISRRVGMELEDIARKREEGLDYVHMDCRRYRTSFQVAVEITRQLGAGPPKRGLSARSCLDRAADHLEREERRAVVALDWLDFQVYHGNSDLLYLLTRLWESRDEMNRISIIGLSRVPDLIERLEPSVQSTFMHNRVELEPYTRKELEGILRRRVDLAFHPGSVDEGAIELIAESAPAADGARVAIDWLLRAGEIADGMGKEGVMLREVRAAKQIVHEKVARRDLENLNDHDLLLLLPAVERMESSGAKSVPTDELEEDYRQICEERGRKPLKHRAVFRRLERLSDLGVVDRRPTRAGEPLEVLIPGDKPALLEGIIQELI